MAIGGIGNYGSYGVSNSFLNYQSSVNQIKLQQALQKASSKYGSSGTDKTLQKQSASFVKEYNSSMSDLMSAANSLLDSNSSGVFNEVTANSSDESVITAETLYKGQSEASYDVNVQQLAQAQVNQSQAVNSRDLATDNISIDVVTNNKNAAINVSATDADGNQKTNKQLLSDVAKEINNQNLGITASIEEKNGKVNLKMTGNNTGTSNSFLVNGDFAQSSGLDNPTKQAQNAIYSVSKDGGTAEEFTSESNNISLDYGKMSATLKKEGSSTVSLGVDNDKIVSAMEKLVKSYNSALGVVRDNAGRGTGVARQLKAMTSSPASAKSMEMIGITQKEDGSLVLDKDKLTKSLTENPDLTKNVISDSAGIARGAFNDARNGLSKSSSSLINNDIATAQQKSFDNPVNFLNMYSRTGAYNMMNYGAVGLMMNYLV